MLIRKFKAFLNILSIIFYPVALLIYKRKSIWIVTEREDEAQDNGFIFFQYLNKHKRGNFYYAINKKSPAKDKVSQYGKVISYGSFKHILLFYGSKYCVSSTIDGLYPNKHIQWLAKKIKFNTKLVFLQHGIIKDDLPYLYAKNQKIDMFVCGALPEYLFIKNTFGYKEDVVKYTGLARYDNYIDTKKEQVILIFPTWRKGLEKDVDSSLFVNEWKKLLYSKDFNEFLNNEHLLCVFYLHPLFQKYSKLFSNTNLIKIVDKNTADIQHLILSSKMLITDYSSVFFDFAYQRKPVIYYQFDVKNYRESHYKEGYFSYTENGFGPVFMDSNSVINYLYSLSSNKFQVEKKYNDIIDKYFVYNDNKNCERIYEEIIKIK